MSKGRVFSTRGIHIDSYESGYRRDSADLIDIDDSCVCYYLDHTLIDPRELALLSSRIKQANSDLFRDGLLICTCHRIEVYFPNFVCHDPIAEILDIRAKRIQGKEILQNRLLAIACGLESIILGEKFIYWQVAQAVEDLPDNHTMKAFGCLVLEKAKQIRERRNFYATEDYEGISLSLMERWASSSDAETLIVVGAGMLSHQVAQYAGTSNYYQVAMVSRVAKKFRKKHRNTPCPFQVYSMHTLPQTLLNSAFDCFIATTNICAAYQERLREIIDHDHCKSVIDMSSIPAFAPETISDKLYMTMYDTPFLHEVRRSNKNIILQKEYVKRDIQNVSGELR